MKKLSDDNFSEEVLNFKDVSIVEFTGKWCSPCKEMAKTLAKLESSYNGQTKFSTLDIWENKKTATLYNIKSIPTTIIFEKGRPRNQLNGNVSTYKIRKAIDELL